MPSLLNNLSDTAKSVLVLVTVLVPVTTTSVAIGGYLASRNLETRLSIVESDVRTVDTKLMTHVDNPRLHVVTADQLEKINRRLCLLMEANGIRDADCP